MKAIYRLLPIACVVTICFKKATPSMSILMDLSLRLVSSIFHIDCSLMPGNWSLPDHIQRLEFPVLFSYCNMAIGTEYGNNMGNSKLCISMGETPESAEVGNSRDNLGFNPTNEG